MISVQQALSFGLVQRGFNCLQRQSSALAKLPDFKAVRQSKRVNHELKTQFITADFSFFVDGMATGGLLHIAIWLFVAGLSNYSMWE